MQRDSYCEENLESDVHVFDAGEGECLVQWLCAVRLSHSIAIGDISKHPLHSIGAFSTVGFSEKPVECTDVFAG